MTNATAEINTSLNPPLADTESLLAQLGVATGGLNPFTVLRRYLEAEDLELGYFAPEGEEPVWIVSDEAGNVYAASGDDEEE